MMRDDQPLWPPRAPEAKPPPPAAPERHARWIDADNRGDEPREAAPNLIWWILAVILVLAVISVMIRTFLVL